MKNFPHQINQIQKLVRALEIIQTLIDSNQDISNDGVLGYALARSYVYTFRNHAEGDDLEERIRQEQRKSNSNQGARTCARDLRRLFLLLGFINTECEITQLGENIIDAGCDIEDSNVRNIWRQALNQMELYSDDGQISHPYRILIRLVNENVGLGVSKLALALEADNDTEEEFNRILNISREYDWTAHIYASEHQLRNAVKILPALAKQIGDITVNQDCCYTPHNEVIYQVDNNSNENDEILREHNVDNAESRQPRRSRHVTADEIARIPSFEDDESSGNEENNVNLAGAIRTRLERTTRHNQLVRFIAEFLQNAGYQLLENPMDCLGIMNNRTSILIEAKTLNGTIEDERKQVRLALAQLLYYEEFNLTELNEGMNVCKIALFEAQIELSHIQFLENHNCLVLWFENDELTGSQRAIQFLESENINNN